ncbi:MAG: IS66 family transposase [Acidobacteria bacterium]|nr:IS66 family transposase [Acidobacteriota bacterium]
MYQLAKSHDYGINTCQQCLAKQREIDRLIEENQRLRAKLAQQKRKDQEGFFGSSTPSAQLPVKANSTQENNQQRGGAKPGHKGAGRKKHAAEEADCIRTVAVEPLCPSCHCLLTAKDVRERSVLDIDPITVKRVLYRLERKECPCCGVTLQATAPGVLPKSLLSNQLLSEIVDSHYVQGIPLGRVCARWQLNYGTVIQALHRLGALFAPVMEELKSDYRQALVRHADETTWRTDGQSGYCWLFASERVSLHLYRNTRSARVVEEVFGTEPLAGYLVVDRYVGYKRVPCQVQYCYAHLLREMKDLSVAFADEKEVEAYAERMIELLAEAMRLQSSRPADAEYSREAQRIKQEIAEACTEPSHHLAVHRWQDFFVEEADHLYNWVADRRVPCENNRAERELRPTVIARKVSHGSQAEEGAKTREVLMSVLQTLKKRVADPRQKFKEVLDQLAVKVEGKVSELLFHADDG